MNKFPMPDWSAAFQDFQQKVSGLVGEAPRAEMEKHFRSAVSAALERMDLVTREEFSQQQRLLAQAQDRITALESLLAQKYAEPADSSGSSGPQASDGPSGPRGSSDPYADNGAPR